MEENKTFNYFWRTFHHVMLYNTNTPVNYPVVRPGILQGGGGGEGGRKTQNCYYLTVHISIKIFN